MCINLAFFVFAVVAPQHMARGNFVSDCESGVIDFGKEFMIHLEDNFPEVSERASREMTNIYSNAIRLVTNKEEESQLHTLHDGIGAYLKACNQLLNLNATLIESMDVIEAEMSNMKVAEVCQKPPENLPVFQEILKSTFVSKLFSLEYLDKSLATFVAGGSKALYTVVKSALCLLNKECSEELKKILRESIDDMRDLTKSFLSEILTDVQDGLKNLFKGHFVKLKCDVNNGFKKSCDILNSQLIQIKNRLDRQLRNYQSCLDDKSRVAQKISNFELLKLLLNTL